MLERLTSPRPSLMRRGVARFRERGRGIGSGWLRAVCFVLLVALAGPASAASDVRLAEFAEMVGLSDIGGFVAAIRALDATGRLPPRFLTKEEAERRGWRPGADLCRMAPGKAIGGDRFRNAERRLPTKPGRRYREADLDYACGHRGAHRLVYSNDGLRFVTVDHYRSFRRVPD